jgi:hypothetical protein
MRFPSIEDLMGFIASVDLGNTSLTSMDDIFPHAAHAVGCNKTELSATRSHVIRQLEQRATDISASPTPSAAGGGMRGEPSISIGMVIGSIFAGSLALSILGCVVFAAMKMRRGKPVISLTGLKKKASDVETAEDDGTIPVGPGAGRFY